MSWLQDYVGKPWREDAGGPQAYDCKGLVRAVQRRVWGREVPALLGITRLTDWSDVRASCEREGWRPTNALAADGDILVVRGCDGPHVGVFVRHGRRLAVLHAHSFEVDGQQRGRVRINSMADLLHGGYARPQIWRFTQHG